jgi:hypothetical protein
MKAYKREEKGPAFIIYRKKNIIKKHTHIRKKRGRGVKKKA